MLRRADVITLVRGARKGRLLARCIAVAGLDRHAGILGQSKIHGATAQDITPATLHVIRTFCQVVGDPPRKRQRAAMMVPMPVDLELEAHLLQHFEAIIVDTASDDTMSSSPAN